MVESDGIKNVVVKLVLPSCSRGEGSCTVINILIINLRGEFHVRHFNVTWAEKSLNPQSMTPLRL